MTKNVFHAFFTEKYEYLSEVHLPSLRKGGELVGSLLSRSAVGGEWACAQKRHD